MDSLALLSAINVTTMLQLAKVHSNMGRSLLNIETLSVNSRMEDMNVVCLPLRMPQIHVLELFLRRYIL